MNKTISNHKPSTVANTTSNTYKPTNTTSNTISTNQRKQVSNPVSNPSNPKPPVTSGRSIFVTPKSPNPTYNNKPFVSEKIPYMPKPEMPFPNPGDKMRVTCFSNYKISRPEFERLINFSLDDFLSLNKSNPQFSQIIDLYYETIDILNKNHYKFISPREGMGSLNGWSTFNDQDKFEKFLKAYQNIGQIINIRKDFPNLVQKFLEEKFTKNYPAKSYTFAEVKEFESCRYSAEQDITNESNELEKEYNNLSDYCKKSYDEVCKRPIKITNEDFKAERNLSAAKCMREMVELQHGFIKAKFSIYRNLSLESKRKFNELNAIVDRAYTNYQNELHEYNKYLDRLEHQRHMEKLLEG